MFVGNDTSLVEYERLRSVFAQAPMTVSINVVNAVLTAIVLGPMADAPFPYLWLAAIAGIAAVRWIGAQTLLRRPRPAGLCQNWAAFSVITTLVTGALWGFCGTALFPAAESNQLFLALVIGGMGAGALAISAAHFPSLLAFVLPSILPLSVSFFAQGRAWRVSAAMVIIYTTALCLVGLRSHRAFGQRVRLQLALEREQHKLNETNARLTGEVAQRQIAEATLYQAQKMEAIGHLTGGFAHDFNNLLQIMIGNLDFIQRLSADNPRVLKYADAAEQAALRGAELTNSLLTFARRQTLAAQPVDINLLLREFEALLVRTVSTTVRFRIVLTPDLPNCHADPAHFRSAVLNLVINARDAMPEGGLLSVTSGVETLGPKDLIDNPDATPGRFVFVSVRDTGSGMSPEVMSRVFEPFFTTKGVGKGSGLGLSQVYGFARQSRGHIGLVSTLNGGTQATLWLPVSTAEASVLVPTLPVTPQLIPDHRLVLRAGTRAQRETVSMI